MRWPTWDQSLTLTIVCVVIVLVARRRRPSPWTNATIPAAKELAIVAALYTVWRLARELPLVHDAGAIDRGRQIDRFQHAVGLPSELSLQGFVLDHELLARFLNIYYAVAHVPGIIAFLIWMFLRRPGAYPRWRTSLAIVTAFCLFIRFVRVAPPRLVPELGYVDLSSLYGLSVYGPVGTGVSDQFAAMPSIHVAWAAVVSFGLFATISGGWRWLALLHVVITTIAVSATGHHWWLDSIIAVALLGIAVLIEALVRRAIDDRRHRRELARLRAATAGELRELEAS